jgi:hypothetical protein
VWFDQGAGDNSWGERKMSIGQIVDITREPLLKRIAELERDLRDAQLTLQRIDEALVGSYGEIGTLDAKEARRMLRKFGRCPS